MWQSCVIIYNFIFGDIMAQENELSRLLKEITILYVEDEDNIREDLEEVLTLFCQNILTAKNGEEAYRLYKEKNPHIILTDINMPKMDGISLVKKIRKDDLTTAIIFLTAHTNEENLFSAANLNIQAYISKPTITYKKIKEILFQAVEFLNLTTKLYIHINEKLSYDKVSGLLIYENDQKIKLNKKEKALMDLLVMHKNSLLTYSKIENSIWNPYEEVMTSNALRSVVKNLRKKSPVQFIENISGQGYKLLTS